MFLAPSAFAVNEAYPKFLLGSYTETNVIGNIPTNTPLFIDNPSNTFLAQGRITNTYNLQDNANWVKGAHNISFGFQTQQVRITPYNDAAIVPFYNIGLPVRQHHRASPSGELPGITGGDLNTANTLYAFLGGSVNDYSQTFNITSRNSRLRERRHQPAPLLLRQSIAGYFQDNWRVRAAADAEPGRALRLLGPRRRARRSRPAAAAERQLHPDAAFERDPRFRRQGRRSSVLQQRPQQLRAERRLRLGCLRQRQDRPARRLQHLLRE